MIPNKDLVHEIARREHRGLMAEVTSDNINEWLEYFKKEEKCVNSGKVITEF